MVNPILSPGPADLAAWNININSAPRVLDRNHGTLKQSFDFSKLPNIQEASFGVGWIGCSLHWIPAALSTFRPATSQRLSAICFNFTRVPIADQSVETLIKDLGDDLRWIAAEITRIEREFKGAVDFTLHLAEYSGYGVVSDALGITVRFRAVDDISSSYRFIFIHFPQVLQQYIYRG